MLETKELVKIYKPKKGVPVTALNKVSLKFPEKGMVFLLGKSGSGKSTLLNVLGGLDNYNGGEIIIKGVSSKEFRQKHFDSYRNTYVGFIFQEYNVLDDFTVGANIALAIELQNRKATDEEINDILKEVDLEGYGSRKPNELSGGQKQRVAIARALVKNPQIIMADEPTGALDSNTGKQVFETLKKLSKEKLVIVVSHDREFAENYADRIIELSDGAVISDVELSCSVSVSEEKGISFSGNTVDVPVDYHLTEQDRLAINEYIDKLKTGSLEMVLSSKASSNKKFTKTDESKIKAQDSSSFKLIKSKLPLKSAFKIGSGGLKHKKIRLVITILLSCISFGLFGLADTFGAYNHINTCTDSLIDSQINYIATAKSKQVGKGTYSYWRDYGYKLSDADLKAIEKNTGVEMHGVYYPIDADLTFNTQIDQSVKLTETDFSIYNSVFSGFAPINETIINNMNFKLLAGFLPDGSKNEMAISEYIFEIFKKAKYTDGVPVKKADGSSALRYTEIANYSDIIGKTLILNDEKYTITAVIDTNFDIDRYVNLTKKKEYQSKADTLVDYVLYKEFCYASEYSYAGLIMTGDGHIEKLIGQKPPMSLITEGYLSFYVKNGGVDSQYLAKLSDVKNEKIIWLNGEKKVLADKEIIITSDTLNFWGEDGKDPYVYKEDGSIDYAATLKNAGEMEACKDLFSADESDNDTETGYKIVGVIEVSQNEEETHTTADKKSRINSCIISSDKLFNEFVEGGDCNYSFSVGAMPKGKSDVKTLVDYCYREDSNMRYQIQNSVTYELDSINEDLKQMSKIFLYIGIGFAAFAALMLANFIGISISYKKQEIGVLRAIGSRSNDVFRIFFAESFIIAMINFVLSGIGVFIATLAINYILRNELGILVTVLHFSVRQVLLLLAVSIFVAFIASFVPVKKIASKKPIDAIRDR